MKDVAGYARIAVPYPGGDLPGFRLQAKGKELSTFIFHGGYDSFVEEFYGFLLPLTELGFTVIGFDGPGQGGALRQGIYFEHAWEKPAKAVLDYFKLDAVDWLGASCGGYLSIRAAAFEPRIKHIISLPTTYSGLDMMFKADGAGQGATVDIAVQGRRPPRNRGTRGRTAHAELRVRLVHNAGDAHHRYPDAVRFSHGHRAALARRHSAQRQTGYPADGRGAGPPFQR